VKRPAEHAAAGGGLVAVLVASLGASASTVAAVAAVAGAFPHLVTYVLTHGGIKGVASSLWRGR